MARTLIATEMGAKRAKEALIDLGITQTVLAEKRLKYSRSTVSNFFNRKPIAHENFTEICKILKLEWRDIAEITDGEAISDNEQESSATATSAKSARQEFQKIDNKVKQVETQIRLAFAIAGTVDQVDQAKLTAILNLLRQITNDASISIVDVQEGSIKLILTGTPEALVKIQTLYRSRKLEEIEGASVVNVVLENLSGADFRGADLSGADLKGADFRREIIFSDDDLFTFDYSFDAVRTVRSDVLKESNALILRHDEDLSASNDTEIDNDLLDNYYQANLSEANLSEANLSEANLSTVNLSGANLSYANLSRSDLIGANLSGANLREANLSGANLKHANLSRADLFLTDLIGANLDYVDFSGDNLGGANLSGAKLIQVDFSGANLSCATLSRTDLSYMNLSEANLSEANLRGANLSEANLNGADLSRANLRGADLSRANLSGANLRGADLSRANLSGADLSGADLSRANLSGANLILVRLFGVNLSGAIVKSARFRFIYSISEEMKLDLISRGAIFDDV